MYTQRLIEIIQTGQPEYIFMLFFLSYVTICFNCFLITIFLYYCRYLSVDRTLLMKRLIDAFFSKKRTLVKKVLFIFFFTFKISPSFLLILPQNWVVDWTLKGFLFFGLLFSVYHPFFAIFYIVYMVILIDSLISILAITKSESFNNFMSVYFFLNHPFDKETILAIWGNPITATATKVLGALAPFGVLGVEEVYIAHEARTLAGWDPNITEGRPFRKMVERYWEQRKLIEPGMPSRRFLKATQSSWNNLSKKE